MDAITTREITAKVRQVDIKTRKLVTDALTGRYRSVFKGRGMHFDEVREYVPGDEVRTIDWNVTARSGRPFVKKFTEEREQTILLVVDVSASGLFGSRDRSKREQMAELAAVLAFSAAKTSDRVGLLLVTDEVELFIPPGKGRKRILRIVREILFFEPRRRGTDLVRAMEYLSRTVRRRAVVFLISDFCLHRDRPETMADLYKTLSATAGRHDLVAVPVTDPRESALPDAGLLTLEDAETGEQVVLDTSDPEVRAEYERLAGELAGELHGTLARAGADVLPLSADEDYMPALLRFFQSRERRAGR